MATTGMDFLCDLASDDSSLSRQTALATAKCYLHDFAVSDAAGERLIKQSNSAIQFSNPIQHQIPCISKTVFNGVSKPIFTQQKNTHSRAQFSAEIEGDISNPGTRLMTPTHAGRGMHAPPIKNQFDEQEQNWQGRRINKFELSKIFPAPFICHIRFMSGLHFFRHTSRDLPFSASADRTAVGEHTVFFVSPSN